MNLNWSHIQEDVKNLIEDSAPARHLLKALKFSAVKDYASYYSIQLAVENKLTLQMCERLFLPQLKNVLEARLGLPIAFEFLFQSSQEPFQIIEPADAEAFEATAEKTIPAIQPHFKFKSKFSLNPRYQSSTFCVTDENRLAKLATDEFVKSEDLHFTSMLLTGPSGTGKTHLLNAVGWNFISTGQRLKVKMISGDDLITDFQTAIFRRTMSEFRLKYRLETDILLIDDIHCLERAKATQTELFNLLNDFQNAGKKIVLTCDRPIQNIENFDERLKSRLLGSLNVQLEYPSLAAKEKILNHLLQSAEIALQPHLLERVLLNAGPCIRSLEGAIHRLQMLRKTSGSLDPLLLEKMFPAVLKSDFKSVDIDTLLSTICRQHQITLKELKGTSRKRSLVIARRECASALKIGLKKSTAEIGRILQRDHSTVISLLKTASQVALK